MPYAQARRLLFEGKRCVGVEYTHEGEVKEARANVEVIVSGNTNAPTLMIAEKAADMIKAATNGSHS